MLKTRAKHLFADCDSKSQWQKTVNRQNPNHGIVQNWPEDQLVSQLPPLAIWLRKVISSSRFHQGALLAPVCTILTTGTLEAITPEQRTFKSYSCVRSSWKCHNFNETDFVSSIWEMIFKVNKNFNLLFSRQAN